MTHSPLLTKTIRPIAASSLYGIATYQDKLWAIDARGGYLLEIAPLTENTKILNSSNTIDFIGARGIAIADDTLWFTSDENIYYCSLSEQTWKPQLFIRLSYPADGIAVWGSTIYITCQKTGEILIYNRQTQKKITHFYTVGIGIENITVKEEEIWLTDELEQTVYCLERATGEVKFSILTPFENPMGLTFYTDPHTQQEILYVCYGGKEVYIRDNPNANPNHELQYRDRIFIHPLHFKYNSEQKYTLSNGYLIEMSYVE